MPILDNKHLVGLHEPIDKMTNAQLRDYANALQPFMKTNPITVGRKIQDIHAELEWRRAAHSNAKKRPGRVGP